MSAIGSEIPILAISQGDPAGVGLEVAAKLLGAGGWESDWRPLVVAEKAALEALPDSVQQPLRERLLLLDHTSDRSQLMKMAPGSVPVLDPVGDARQVIPGSSSPADAAGALAALDLGIELARSDVVDALVTLPVSKFSIARQHRADFRGHTDYLAAAAGLEHYGRDYLMAFLAPELRVALLTTHIPLAEAIESLDEQAVVDALSLLDRHVGGRIAVAGLNPHAGEEGLLGREELEVVAPAVLRAREMGVDAHGPESPDTVFARARQGEFDWVLALYHDQGLIAVKTCGFGLATNWTMGLPFLRTSVDHGTAFAIAGRGVADEKPLARVIETTLAILAKRHA